MQIVIAIAIVIAIEVDCDSDNDCDNDSQAAEKKTIPTASREPLGIPGGDQQDVSVLSSTLFLLFSAHRSHNSYITPIAK